jgi:type I restriction enzyme S subunit
MSAVREGGGITFEQTISAQDGSAGLSYFEEGDVVIAKITPCFENGKCALARGIPGGRALGTTELHVLRPNNLLLSEFLLYSCLSDRFRRLGEASMSGAAGQKRVSLEFLADFPLQFPDRAGQQRIVACLDRETAKIDDLIAKKRRLIDLLEERTAAYINRTVTKGLNTAAPMTDTGLEWLGPMPAHWHVGRVGTVADVVRGASPRPAGSPEYFHGDHTPWITVGDITKDATKYLDSTETSLTAEGAKLSRAVPEGTLLLTNSGATLGVPKITRIAGCINDGSVALLRQSKEVEKEYLYYFLKSTTKLMRARLRQGAGQPNLNTDLVKATIMPVPPLDEQTEIVKGLDLVSERRGSSQAIIAMAIDRLREYRAALITAAVTGQLDLRKHEKQMEAIA